MIEHGTYAGYQKCRRNDFGPCPACKQAATDYQRNRLNTNPQARQRARHSNNVRVRVLWRLAQLHPRDYERLVREETTK